MKLLIIPAAGQATRLRPLSNHMSKAMVPVAGKPVIGHIVDAAGGYFDAVVVVYGANPDIPRYVNSRYRDTETLCVRQESALGPLHAVHCGMVAAMDVYGDRGIGQCTVWLGDTLVKFTTADLDVITTTNTVVGHRVPDWNRWCLVDASCNMYDKPRERPDNFEALNALVGVYSFTDFSTAAEITTGIVDRGVRVHGEFQISQLLTAYNAVSDIGVLNISGNWYDFGDLPSLYRSSAALIGRSGLTRPGCSISADAFTGTITKTGPRCANEISWYEEVTTDPGSTGLLPHIPQIFSTCADRNEYTMEFVAGSPVSDFLLYEQISDDSVEFIIRKTVQVYANSFAGHAPDAPDAPGTTTMSFANATEDMWVGKTTARVRAYSYDWMDPADVTRVLLYIQEHGAAAAASAVPSVIHGDYHLGNIMFDPATAKVKMIDPRGSWSGYTNPAFGDRHYDVAKLLQSVYGEYVWLYPGVAPDRHLSALAKSVLDSELVLSGLVTEKQLSAVKLYVPILLASCIGFHADCPARQIRIWEHALNMM